MFKNESFCGYLTKRNLFLRHAIYKHFKCIIILIDLRRKQSATMQYLNAISNFYSRKSSSIQGIFKHLKECSFSRGTCFIQN